MSKARAANKDEGATKSFRAYWALAALLVGLALGALSGNLTEGARASTLGVAGFIGTLWLNALKMTVIPLVVALLVTGIAKSAEAALGGRIAGRSVLWIVIVCTVSAVFGALMIELLTHFFPLARGTASGLQAALAGVEQKASGPLPGVADFFKGVVPDNVVAAAANGDILPLVVFAVLFALALGRIAEQGRRSIVALFEAIGDALLVIIAWVLWIAPLGVLALAYTVGSAAVVVRVDQQVDLVVGLDLVALGEGGVRSAVGLERLDPEMDRTGGIPDQDFGRLGGGRGSIRRPWPLRRADLGHRHPCDVVGLPAGGRVRARVAAGIH